MYEEYFGLGRRPFAAAPQVEQYFPAAAVEAARQTLIRCVERAEGIGIVVGPSGTGKTLLCQMLSAHFKGSLQVAVLLSGRLASRRALLQTILFELGRPYRGMDEGELRLALAGHLANGEDCPHGMVLVVDEAHTLPLRLLEEIRMIANLVGDGEPRVRPVLAGGPVLEERLASPQLESFSQRIVARCYLESFDRSETHEYIRTQLDRAGGQPEEIISAEACQAVYQATDGIPRLVNQLCDHALVLAYAAGRQPVDRARVEEAWADLQQLPTPWNEEDRGESGESGVIEFGGLDDEPDDGPQADPDRPATISLLRVADASDGPPPDPAEQVTQIQETLDRLDDDFQPAGSIGPEVELVFEQSADPFDESFEQEEVIVDRVAATAGVGEATSERSASDDLGEADLGGTVTCLPAEEAAERIDPESSEARREEPPRDERFDEPHDAPRDEPVDEPVEKPVDEPVEEADEKPVEEPDEKPVERLDEEPVEEPHEEPAMVASAVTDLEATVGTASERETVASHPEAEPEEVEPAAPAEPDTGPSVLVEQAYDEEIPAGPPPAPPRRQEYRRLFTKLREGR